MKTPYVLLCTGGIGSGKSVVVRLFRELGIPSYDCDRAAKELYDRDPHLRADMVRLCGEGILDAGGRLDLILTCTAISEEDPRRKPHPGMFYEACSLFPDIDAKSSVMVGDSASDAAFADNSGMSFILLH